MFKDNHIEEVDLKLRSILENGTEPVPDHIWDGITRGLDKAAARRTILVWFRRSAVAVSAAAAALAGVFLGKNRVETVVPASEDVIAVVTPAVEHQAGHEFEQSTLASDQAGILSENTRLLAYTEEVAPAEAYPPREIIEQQAHTTPQHTETAAQTSETVPQTEETIIPVVTDTPQKQWEDNESEIRESRRKPVRASFTVSGIAGTNSPQDKGGQGPMKIPALSQSYSKTTIEQTSPNTTYGIPLSFGAGVRISFNDRWAIGTGLNYSLLTSRFDGKYIKVGENSVEDFPIYGKTDNYQHYIGIPVNAYYNIVNRDFINFYAYAGGTVEKCVANRYTVQAVPVIHHKEKVKGVQLSANIGIGVEFSLGKYLGLYIDPSLRYYFYNGQPKSIRTAQPLMLGFEMGFRFKL